MIACELDDPDGIIFVHATGRWSIDDVDRHYTHLTLVMEDRRRNGLPIRVLSDVTQAERQSAEVEARIVAHVSGAHRPTDRIAILVADIADKIYLRSRLGDAIIGVFSSQLPAEMWLMSDGLAPPGMATH
ncbi:hypothetical protein [Sphingobium sp.]|uniref:hypothetical protein n=1 Tax=Sphingobium sp. TaxID=1912891 RepID=UPI003B3BAAAB